MSTQYELNPPPGDAISSLAFAPDSSKLLVASWDKNAYLYDIQGGAGQLVKQIEHRAPVLAVAFGNDDTVAFSGGLDWDVRRCVYAVEGADSRLDLGSGDQTVLSSHSAPVNALAFSAPHDMVVSASWDSTFHIHILSDPPVAAEAPLPAKPFAMAVSSSKLVIAMAGRQVHIFDLAALAQAARQAGQAGEGLAKIAPEPFQRRESSLKFMTRALACMPNGEGYATSSIEGRVAVEWFDASTDSQARKYAFKCHRQADDAAGVDVVYPVHALSFHPVHGTFVSGGGDGVVALWDAVAKRRIRQYQKYAASVAAAAFSPDGRLLAVATSPGFEQGKEDVGDGPVAVFVRTLGEGEAKGKSSKAA